MVALLLAWLPVGAGTALAHAVPTGSQPRESEVVESAPRQVTVEFDEPVELAEDSVRVLDPDGRPVTAGDPAHVAGAPDTARVPLTGGLQDGTYTVSWRVLSADGHAISGLFSFSVGAPSAPSGPADAVPAVDGTVAFLDTVARHGGYVGLSLLLGPVVFVSACRPGASAVRSLRRLAVVGWWVSAAAAVARLSLRGPYTDGTGVTGILDPTSLGRALEGRPGIALACRLALLLSIAALARFAPTWRTGLPAAVAPPTLLGVALASTWAATDHAAAGIQVPAAVVSTVVHLVAAAVWTGGLVALWYTLRPGAPSDRLRPEAVGRFSRIALGSVTVLAVTGVYQAWRGLGSWDAFASPYGRLLALKTAAVALMLVVASASRSWSERLRRTARPAPSPAFVGAGGGRVAGERGSHGASPEPTGVPSESGPRGDVARELRRSVLVESVIGLLVLAVTAVLTGTQPGRSAESALVPSAVPGRPDVDLTVIPFDTGSVEGRGRVQVTLEPGRVGRNVVEAVVFGGDGSLVAVPRLRLEFTHPGRGVGPLDAELVDQRGYWGGDTLDLPFAGTWTMRATVLVSEGNQVTVEETVEVTS